MKKIANNMLALVVLLLFSCAQKEDVLVATFDKVYGDVLSQDHDAVSAALNDRSHIYLDELRDPDNHNVDSILSIGKRYRLSYITTEFMAYYSEDLDNQSVDQLFYEYLGSQDASIFSFKNAFYVDKTKLKKGKEVFVPVIKEEMTQNYLKWTRWTGSEEDGYLLDLRYTLELAEIEKKKTYKLLRQKSAHSDDRDAFLRELYWQHSGPNNAQFRLQERNMYQSQRDGRSEILQSYRDRGLVD